MTRSIGHKFYSNCAVLAPDGQLLSRTSKRKLAWYLKKGLADLVDENTIQLKFEPKGRVGVNDPFITSAKQDVCAACGKDKELNRHHIVPNCFLRYFPVKPFKCRHDIVLLCLECHDLYELSASDFKLKLVEEIGLKMHGFDLLENLHRIRVVKTIKSLLNVKRYIPPEKKQKMLDYIKPYIPPNKDLKTILEGLPDKISPWEKVVEANKHDLPSFVKRWRQHFVDSMNPKFLPVGWDVNREPRYI